MKGHHSLHVCVVGEDYHSEAGRSAAQHADPGQHASAQAEEDCSRDPASAKRIHFPASAMLHPLTNANAGILCPTQLNIFLFNYDHWSDPPALSTGLCSIGAFARALQHQRGAGGAEFSLQRAGECRRPARSARCHAQPARSRRQICTCPSTAAAGYGPLPGIQGGTH